jgi:hypothetical protein
VAIVHFFQKKEEIFRSIERRKCYLIPSMNKYANSIARTECYFETHERLWRCNQHLPMSLWEFQLKEEPRKY